MKRLRLIFCIICVLALTTALFACTEAPNGDTPGSDTPGSDTPGGDTPALKDFTGLSFEDAEFTYDGTDKSIAVAGTLPQGATVSYSPKSATNAGEYNITATVACEGYNTKTFTAKLTVKKADITGISAEATQSVTYDQLNHKPTYTGTLPAGVSCKLYVGDTEYENGIQNAGTYQTKLVFSGSNYNELVLNVEFKIKMSASAIANAILDSFGSVPDPWEFLPESLSNKEQRVISSMIDYSDFVNTSNLPKFGAGKQLNVVYGLLLKTESALKYVNTVYASMNTVKALYTEFIAQNPDDYNNFSSTVAGISFTIATTETNYSITASIGSVQVVIRSNLAEEAYETAIKLNSTTSIKCRVSNDSMTVAMDVLDSSSVLVEFVKTSEGAVGYLYEYLGALGVELKTSAIIEIDENYTTVIGTKGDFIPTSDGRNCEIYDNQTGSLVGTKVKEAVNEKVYNTYWIPLYNLLGVNSIKKLDQMNGTNPDTIYINSATQDTLHTTLVGGFGSDMFSRRYDIEFKTLYFYTYNEEEDSFNEVAMEVPMLFIQAEHLDTFESDFENKNGAYLGSSGVSLNVGSADLAKIDYAYTTLLGIFDTVSEKITHQAIIDFCKS